MPRWSVLPVAFVVAGCATLFNGKSKSVSFNSNPVGAEVYLNGQRIGSTPLSFDVQKNKSYLITFKKAGYADMTCNIGRGVGAGWVVLDVLGGLIPVVIDAATGSWYGLNRDACNETLTSAAAGS